MFPPTFGQGGHNIFYAPQHFVIKTNIFIYANFMVTLLLETLPQHKIRE